MGVLRTPINRSEAHIKRANNTASKTITTNSYYNGSEYLLGSVDRVTTNRWDDWNGGGSADNTSYIDNTYDWHGGAVLASVANDVEGDGSPIYYTTMTLGTSGQLYKATIGDGLPRTVHYTNDINGQVLIRDEVLNAGGNAPHEIAYRFGGKIMGQVTIPQGTLSRSKDRSP